MARPSETAQVDIGPDEIVKSNSCSNGSYMIDVSLVIYLYINGKRFFRSINFICTEKGKKTACDPLRRNAKITPCFLLKKFWLTQNLTFFTTTSDPSTFDIT